jgi:hypothetical protein
MWPRFSCLQKLYLVFILSAAAFLTIAVRQVLFPNEPHYHGRGLTAWLYQSRHHTLEDQYDRQRPARMLEADDAIRQIGTNALPRLLKMLVVKERPPRSIIEFCYSAAFLLDRKSSRLALSGFEVLGPIARPAVPALINLLNDQDAEIRCQGANGLAAIGPAAADAIPTLLQHMADRDGYVELCSISALGRIHQQPELVVPALLPYLAKGPLPNPTAMEALAGFGDQAKSAVPALLRLLSHPQRQVRIEATNALQRIAPSAAAQPGVK